MRLSDLQRYILRQAYIHGPQCSRSHFVAFYQKPSEAEVKIVTKSIERLISKGLLIGYGHKTAEKLYIDRVSLTPRGRTLTKIMVRDQQKLPLVAKKKTT